MEYLRQSVDLLVETPLLKRPEEILAQRREMVEGLSRRMGECMQHRLTREQGRLSALSGTLDALSPLKVLSRGYAIVKKDGQVIKRASDVSPGDRVAIRLAEGALSAEILGKGE